jgi:hypothetical protein
MEEAEIQRVSTHLGTECQNSVLLKRLPSRDLPLLDVLVITSQPLNQRLDRFRQPHSAQRALQQHIPSEGTKPRIAKTDLRIMSIAHELDLRTKVVSLPHREGDGCLEVCQQDIGSTARHRREAGKCEGNAVQSPHRWLKHGAFRT